MLLMTGTSKKILLYFMLAGLLLTYLFYFVQHEQSYQQQLINKEQQLLVNQLKQAPVKSDRLFLSQESPTVIIDAPSYLTHKQIYTDLKQQHLVAPATANQVIKVTVTPKKQLEGVNYFHYDITYFNWQTWLKNWKQSAKTSQSHFYWRLDTDRLLTLGDLFKGQALLTKINHQQQMDQLKKTPNQLDTLLDMSLLKEDMTNFSYQDKQIVVNTPKKTWHLPFHTYAAFMEQPLIPKSFRQKTKELYQVQTTPEPKIALTFDDGPHPETTQKILDILNQHQVPATFFVLGKQAARYPDILTQLVKQGHEIGNHSFSHPNLETLTPKEVKTEILKTQQIVYQITGTIPQYVRPPYGNISYNTAQNIATPIVNWDVDSLDWKTKNPEQIMIDIKKQLSQSNIILLHDIHQTTAETLDNLLVYLKQENYQLVTISELLNREETPMTVYYSGYHYQEIKNKD